MCPSAPPPPLTRARVAKPPRKARGWCVGRDSNRFGLLSRPTLLLLLKQPTHINFKMPKAASGTKELGEVPSRTVVTIPTGQGVFQLYVTRDCLLDTLGVIKYEEQCQFQRANLSKYLMYKVTLTELNSFSREGITEGCNDIYTSSSLGTKIFSKI